MCQAQRVSQTGQLDGRPVNSCIIGTLRRSSLYLCPFYSGKAMVKRPRKLDCFNWPTWLQVHLGALCRLAAEAKRNSQTVDQMTEFLDIRPQASGLVLGNFRKYIDTCDCRAIKIQTYKEILWALFQFSESKPRPNQSAQRTGF